MLVLETFKELLIEIFRSRKEAELEAKRQEGIKMKKRMEELLKKVQGSHDAEEELRVVLGEVEEVK